MPARQPSSALLTRSDGAERHKRCSVSPNPRPADVVVPRGRSDPLVCRSDASAIIVYTRVDRLALARLGERTMPMKQQSFTRQLRRVTVACLTAVAGLAALFLGSGLPADAGDDAPDSCVDCHSNPDFLVTQKQLYDYFQDWTRSIHRQEGVTCDDCHGGNSELADKKAAHGRQVTGQSQIASAVNFRNIPDTCGECHEDIRDGFLESDHYDHLLKKKQGKQGPSCVTCHGSINVAVLDVNTVKKACERCHSEETNNHPDIPAEATDVLSHLLSINRLYRYVRIRGDPIETRDFFETLDTRMHDFSVLWHTFDLPKIETEVHAIVSLLKQKRGEIRAREKSAKR